MGNRRQRGRLSQEEIEKAWTKLRTVPRSPDNASGAPGTGIPRIKLAVLPAFTKAAFWEICRQGDEWQLFRSEVLEYFPSSIVGYDRIEFSSEKLEVYFQRLMSLSLPLEPHFNNMGGADGTVCCLTILGDLFSEVRLRFWSDYPPKWRPLVALCNEMAIAFGFPQPFLER